MDETRGRAGRCEGGGDLARDMTALAHAGHDHAAGHLFQKPQSADKAFVQRLGKCIDPGRFQPQNPSRRSQAAIGLVGRRKLHSNHPFSPLLSSFVNDKSLRRRSGAQDHRMLDLFGSFQRSARDYAACNAKGRPRAPQLRIPPAAQRRSRSLGSRVWSFSDFRLAVGVLQVGRGRLRPTLLHVLAFHACKCKQ